MSSDERGLYVYGAGGHGLVVAEAATKSGWRVLGMVDEKPASGGGGMWPITRDVPADAAQHGIIVAIGDNMARRRIAADLAQSGLILLPVVHPAAVISITAILGKGIYIGPGAIVNAMAQIDDGAIINSGAIIEHHCRVGAYSHIGPGAILAGDVRVGELSTIGAGASVKPGVRIGDNVTIGAGAAVVRDVASGQVFAGVPAKSIR